jgi:hypothetical protein
MDYRDFIKIEPVPGAPHRTRRVRSFPMHLVVVAPGQQQMMYHDEYEAMLAAEEAAKDALRASRQAELAASRAPSPAPAAPDQPHASLTPEVEFTVEGESTVEVESTNEGESTAENAASHPPAPLALISPSEPSHVPDFSRHSRRCSICSHPDRDAIEGEFIRWRSPQKIAKDYDLPDRTAIYRHAHAAGLFQARRSHIGRVLESFLETIDDSPPSDFDPVTRAVRVYAHLDHEGNWLEAPRTLRILTGPAFPAAAAAALPDADTIGPANA